MNFFKRFIARIDPFLDFTDEIRRRDKSKLAKICCALGYLFFFIPTIMLDDNQFGQFHANQSLLNLILFVGAGILVGFFVTSQVVLWIALVLNLFCLFNTIRGIVLSLQGKAKGIPFLGWITVVPYRLIGQ